MKNVNPRRVLDLLKQMSTLVEKKFQVNDADFFLQLEKFIEQENLSDQRFCVVGKYTMQIPQEYSIIKDEASYQTFLESWKSERSERSEEFGELGRVEKFTDSNFLGIKEQLIPGRQYIVTKYGVKSHSVSNNECLQFLKKEQAGLYGLSGLLTILDLNPMRITSHDHKVISMDYPMHSNTYGIYAAQKSMRLNIEHYQNKSNSISMGSVILGFQLK